MLPCTALRLAAPNGAQSERNISPVEVQTECRSHSEGDPVRRWSARRPLTTSDRLEHSTALVRQLLAIASAFSRSVVEGFSKASRTIVEALSKDCRTTLEQQSNNSRRNIEESCVCTHAKAPARSGLGLALGLAAFFFFVFNCHALAQYRPTSSKQSMEETKYQQTIMGTVVSASTDMPIEGARIRLVGTDTVVFTDREGVFMLVTERKEGAVEAMFSGYLPLAKPFDSTGINAAVSVFRLPTDVSAVEKIILGDTIPSRVWDLPLHVVNHPEGRNTVTLREYRDKKLIVLDFWAPWCSPCVKSVDHWQKVQKELLEELAVITVHVDFVDRALPFIKKRGWSVPTVVGLSGDTLNAHFHNARQVGSVIWIYGDRFFAAPKNKKYPLEDLKKLLAGQAVGDIVSKSRYLHTRK